MLVLMKGPIKAQHRLTRPRSCAALKLLKVYMLYFDSKKKVYMLYIFLLIKTNYFIQWELGII